MDTRQVLVTLLVAGAAASGGAVSSAQVPGTASAGVEANAAPLRIVAFGDSLTSGHRLPASEAYPALLERALHEAGLPFVVENHGVNGDTSAGGVRRLERALAQRPHVLIVAFGANDGLRGVPVKDVRANLATIIETAQARGVKVLLVGMEALPIHGWQYTIDFHQIFPDLAHKYGVPLVPFMLNGVFGRPEMMASDGVHPNADGARVIADNIWSELRPLVQSLAASASAD